MEVPHLGRAILITATDTGAGKTLATALLARWCVRNGRVVRVLKPAETGLSEASAGLSDGAMLSEAVEGLQTPEEIVPFRFRAPAAPLVAARLENTVLEPSALEGRILELRRQSPLVLIEGAGGLLVPLAEGYSFAELAARCELEVLVVVGSRLGALNHALLTFEVCAHRGLRMLGYLFNDLLARQPDGASSEEGSEKVALATNRAVLQALSEDLGVPELGYLPHLDLSSEHAQDLALYEGGLEHIRSLARSLGL